jgi:hypothetical protein
MIAETVFSEGYFIIYIGEHAMFNAEPGTAGAGTTRPWPADRVERWPIERLIPYANNARLHSAANLDKIAASIRKWGWTIRRWSTRAACC